MDVGDAHEMRALLLIEVVEVGNVLEVVGVDLAFLGHRVGLHVIGELLHFKGVAFLLEQRLHGVV